MNNYMKTIISGLKQWVSSQKSDWNQNDSSAANFIKNRPFYSEEKEKVLFSGNVETVDDSGFYRTTLSYVPYEIGQEYKVIFAGTAYICKAFNNANIWSGQAVLLGNLGMLNAVTGLEAEDTGEPFFFISLPEEETTIYTQTAGTYDVSISGTVEEVHQIDKKYVPMPDLADVAHTGDYYDLQNTPYIPWDTVRYGTTQSLTEGNKKIARNNIGAAAATDVSNLNTSVSNLNTSVSNLNTSVSNLNTLVGDTAVSTQIEDATDECITGLSVSGQVITYTKGDGSTGKITTQDTNTTYNLSNGQGVGSVQGHGGNSSKGYYSTAFGWGTEAIGEHSHAEGHWTVAFGEDSHAEGNSVLASGVCSHAEGGGDSTPTTLTGEANSTEFTVSSNFDYIPVGGKFLYNGNIYEIIEKTESKIILDKALSTSTVTNLGVTIYNSYASGNYSHTEGRKTKASGDYSHAEGYKTDASGDFSHAEGDETKASGTRSHAEGGETTASGDFSHAEGRFNNAIGANSHAEGYNTTASGGQSHAEGWYTIASSRHQHVQGRCNIEDSANKYAHIVGNGEASTYPSNAHTLDWNGVGWFKGGLKVGGTSQDDAAAVEVALKSEATTSKAGLMSASDKSKLDGIQSGANAYTLPAAGSSLGGVKTGGDVTISGGIITVDRDGIVEDAVQEVIIQLGGLPVFGMVDSNNNINITAALEDGVYTLKYENADGSTTEIGTLVVENNAPAYINLADSTSSDWLTNQRINSSGNVVEVTATQRGDDTVVITNFIDIAGVQKLHVKGLDVLSALSSGQNYGRFYVYDSNKSLVVKTAQPSNTTYVTVADYDSSVWIIDCEAYLGEWGYSDERYVRLGGILTGAAEGVIITADENIV